MIEGRCACGKVQYQYDGEITEISMCHCQQCRLSQGSAYAAVSPVDDKRLHFTGAEHIKTYQSSEAKIRAFCEHCGSALYSAKAGLPNIKRLRIGTITTRFTCDKQFHIYTDSKASWHSITDGYVQHRNNKPA